MSSEGEQKEDVAFGGDNRHGNEAEDRQLLAVDNNPTANDTVSLAGNSHINTARQRATPPPVSAHGRGVDSNQMDLRQGDYSLTGPDDLDRAERIASREAVASNSTDQVLDLFRLNLNFDAMLGLRDSLSPVLKNLADLGHLWAPDLERAVKLAMERADSLMQPALTGGERAAVALYTTFCPSLNKQVSQLVNDALRQQQVEAVRPWRDYIWLLLRGLSKLTPLPGGTLYFGLKRSLSHLGDKYYMTGGRFRWGGFFRATRRIEAISQCRVQFHVRFTTGCAFDLSAFFEQLEQPVEFEVVMPPNMIFEVDDVLNAGNGKQILQCRQLDSRDLMLLDMTYRGVPGSTSGPLPMREPDRDEASSPHHVSPPRQAAPIMPEEAPTDASRWAPVDNVDRPRPSSVDLERRQASEGQAAAEAVQNKIKRARERGMAPWGQCKLMLVGEGSAGKTGLSNTLMGRPFQQTASTIGILQCTCDVQKAHIGSAVGEWNEFTAPTREFEVAVAKIIGSMSPRVDLDGSEIDERPTALLGQQEQPSPPPRRLPLRCMRRCLNALGFRSRSAEMITEETETSTQTDDHFDTDIVMRCLADNFHINSKFVISIYDFGGQTVFNVIHNFFLTKQGVYCVVFNMTWLVNESRRVQCLANIKTWLNSIVVHTYDHDKESIAPIFLVGSHKDHPEVNNSTVWAQISNLLQESFKTDVAWCSVEENKSENLWFYPIDNVLGRRDPSIANLMRDVETAIGVAGYVGQERPLAYLETLDSFRALKVSYLSYAKAADIAQQHGVLPDDVRPMLRLFHESGTLMFHDEPGLCDVVILDPISYFVDPVSVVICRHVPMESEPVLHEIPIHRVAQTRRYLQWQRMISEGVVAHSLLCLFLDNYKPHCEILVKLMIKFGFLVELQTKGDGIEYLVPALLPLTNPGSSNLCWSELWTTCYLVFTTSRDFQYFPTISSDELRQCGFLPLGLFERLIGKAVTWAQATMCSDTFVHLLVHLRLDEAVLLFGSKRFRLKRRLDMCAIEINIEGNNVRAVHRRVWELVEKITSECLKSLRCFTALPYNPGSSSSPHCHRSTLGCADFLVSLPYIKNLVKTHSPLIDTAGVILAEADTLGKMFKAWLRQPVKQKHNDVFLSYRWEKDDSHFVQDMFDRFGLYSVSESCGTRKREIIVFLDSHSLQVGRLFQEDFVSNVKNSLVVVPIVSTDAVDRLNSTDLCNIAQFKQKLETDVDNVLVEWCVAPECYASTQSRVRRVLPIFFGSREKGVCNGDFFSDDRYHNLPDVIPTATLTLARDLLQANGITPRLNFMEMSVKDIVRNMGRCLGLKAGDISPTTITADVTNIILTCLNEALAEELQSGATPHPAVGRMDGGDGALTIEDGIEYKSGRS